MNRRFCSEEHHRQYVRAHHEFARKELEKRDPSKLPITSEPEHLAESEEPGPVVSADPVHQPGNVEAEPAVARPDDTTSLPTQVREELAQFLAMVENDRHFYQEILDSTPISIGVIASDQRIRYANASFRRSGREAFEKAKTPRLDELGFRENLIALVDTVRRSEVSEENVVLRPPEQAPTDTLRAAVVPLSTGEILLVIENLPCEAAPQRGESASSPSG